VTFSARRWERDHFQAFQAWSAQRNLPASRIAGLGSVLLEHFHEVLAQPESCQHFVESLPKALQECDDPSTYQEPMAVEAYAYLHLLERYRRFWTVLMRLMEVGCLPLARTEVRLLDIGAGPAPITYAAIDFYQAIHAYSSEQQAERPAGKVLPETGSRVISWSNGHTCLQSEPCCRGHSVQVGQTLLLSILLGVVVTSTRPRYVGLLMSWTRARNMQDDG